jgi:hypothetical protein
MGATDHSGSASSGAAQRARAVADMEAADRMPPAAGPIDYVVVEFPGSRMRGEGLPLLVDLVDRGIIRILDLVFAKKDLDGSVRGIILADLDGDERLDLAVFEGASSGLLDEGDIAVAGKVLEPGSSAGILIYENVWAAPFAAALRRAGGQLVARGHVPPEDVLAALDTTESDGPGRKPARNGSTRKG